MEAVWNAVVVGKTTQSGFKFIAFCSSSGKRLTGLLLKFFFPKKGGLYYKGGKRIIKAFYAAQNE